MDNQPYYAVPSWQDLRLACALAGVKLEDLRPGQGRALLEWLAYRREMARLLEVALLECYAGLPLPVEPVILNFYVPEKPAYQPSPDGPGASRNADR